VVAALAARLSDPLVPARRPPRRREQREAQ
jgi:hypothetical protein